MEAKIKLESFTTIHIISLIIKEFNHLLSKEDQSNLKDMCIFLSQIYRRAYETKDPLYFHLNLIYEGLIGIDNTNLLRKYGIAILQDDFPIEDSSITYLNNFFLYCYICSTKVAISNPNSNESIVSSMFMQLVNEETERIGITEAVDNVFSLCEMISSDIGIDNASIFIVTLLNPLNGYYFQESLIKDVDSNLMTQSAKEFLKYLMPPKDLAQLEDLIINVNCFKEFICYKTFNKVDEVVNYLNSNSSLDNYQSNVIAIHRMKDINANSNEEMIKMIDTISLDNNRKNRKDKKKDNEGNNDIENESI